MADPDIYEVELAEGRGTPIPDYVSIVQDARFWRITPMDVLNMPVEWVRAGRIVRQAEARAQAQAAERYKR